MAFREQQLLSTHSSCYDYIIIAAAMAHKHQNCAKKRAIRVPLIRFCYVYKRVPVTELAEHNSSSLRVPGPGVEPQPVILR